ncbi:hypothetical protein HK098_002490 [Nowakowskiella sp. JEL0407]|nr:hypothetical protein HK098_002490 [Nowakowskiella sp. JEL0407]
MKENTIKALSLKENFAKSALPPVSPLSTLSAGGNGVRINRFRLRMSSSGNVNQSISGAPAPKDLNGAKPITSIPNPPNVNQPEGEAFDQHNNIPKRKIRKSVSQLIFRGSDGKFISSQKYSRLLESETVSLPLPQYVNPRPGKNTTERSVTIARDAGDESKHLSSISGKKVGRVLKKFRSSENDENTEPELEQATQRKNPIGRPSRHLNDMTKPANSNANPTLACGFKETNQSGINLSADEISSCQSLSYGNYAQDPPQESISFSWSLTTPSSSYPQFFRNEVASTDYESIMPETALDVLSRYCADVLEFYESRD